MSTIYRGEDGRIKTVEVPNSARFYCPVQGWFPRGESWCCPRGCGMRSYLVPWPTTLVRWLALG